MALDLTQLVTVEEWIFLKVADAARAGDLDRLDRTIAKVEAQIQLCKRSD